MTKTTLLETIGGIAVFSAVYFPIVIWQRKGRGLGYPLLTQETQKLNQRGIDKVYLLYSTQGIGLSIPKGSLWDGLNSGYLAYFENNQLLIKAPQYSVLAEFATWSPGDCKVSLAKHSISYWSKISGIHINDRNFVVCGTNITDPAVAKSLLKVKRLNEPEYISNLDQLVTQLRARGFMSA